MMSMQVNQGGQGRWGKSAAWGVMGVATMLAACGTSSGGGGGSGYYYADGTGGTGDITSTADTTTTADGTLTDTTGGGADTVAVQDTQTGAAYATCTAASQCVQDACKDAWSPTCGAACVTGTAAAAAPTGNALLTCVSTKCVQGKCAGKLGNGSTCVDDCTASDCGAELVACWSQGATPGSAPCTGSLKCLDGCKSDPKKFTCQAACYTAMGTTGQDQFKALSTCVSQNGGDASKCSKETFTCLGGGATGTDTCYDVAKCAQACDAKDTACVGTCYAKGSANAQSQFQTLLSCTSGANQQACLPQTVTCATPTGSANCLDTANCVNACPAGDAQGACILDCLHNATAKGAQAFTPLAACMQKSCPNCGSNCQSCATSKCLSTAMTCSSN